MEFGIGDDGKMANYNLFDAASRSTIQVCWLTWYKYVTYYA